MKKLSKNMIKQLVEKALAEDKAANDITTRALINPKTTVKCKIIFKEKGVLCGIDLARETFLAVDKKLFFKALKKDGQVVNKGEVIAEITGKARGILTAERTALNFLGHLCGISALTRQFVKAANSKINITDTRKTLPLLREIEKYAVRCAGGVSHRMDLSERFLVKDNHLDILKRKEGIEKNVEFAITRIRKRNKNRKKIEVEVENLKEFKRALILRPDIIMLDNMSAAQIKQALVLRKKINPFVKIEVSGKMTPAKVQKLSSLEIDYISIGMLTHSAKSIDISLEIC